MKQQKRVFGWIEAAFDIVYLAAAFAIGLVLAFTPGVPARVLAGAMALVLAAGDLFHLLPRVAAILTGQEARFARAMGFGKQLTSVTMTIFYVLLWQVGRLLFAPKPDWTELIHILAAIRILLCLLPQNRWLDPAPPIRWAVYRNIPLVLLGAAVAALFAAHSARVPAVGAMPAAIALSFIFYLPVVLLAGKNPRLGMLMLPKTCAYVWMLAMCLHL